MFAIDCPVHGHQVLVPPSRIRGLSNTHHGIVITVECWCGAPVTVRTGRRHRSAVLVR